VSEFVLDASAVLAVLFEEPGGAYVYGVLNGSEISVVNLSEVYATLLEGGMTFEDADELVSPLPFRIRTFRNGHAWQTAKLRPLTRKYGLSLGDRACLATAIFADLPVLTSDRRMAESQGVVGLDIRLIR
jgi:ribonuclease VapC